MRTLIDLDSTPPPDQGSVVTIGTFDGVHLGHRGLIMRTIELARETGAESVALTWDRHPAATLRPDRMPPLLSSLDRKLELLEATGVDATALLRFDKEFSEMSPEDFVRSVLVESLAVRHILVGHDWRFGHGAKGNVELLQELGRELGFEVHGVDLLVVEGEAVSSSRVRRVLGEGDAELARVLLGRPFDIDGRVVRGADRGKDLGFPTANLEADPVLARPPIGIYAGLADVQGLTKPAAISIGVNPTFGGQVGTSPVNLEAYLLDFEADIYDSVVRLEFWKRLRDEVHFTSVDDLVAQMNVDVEQTRSVIGTR